MDKQSLRKEIKQALEGLDVKLFEQKSLELSLLLKHHLCEISKQKVFTSLGVYAPIKKEPLWFLTFEAQDFDYSIVHMHEQLKLSFHPALFEHIEGGKYGVRLTEIEQSQEVTPEVILIPGMAFTNKGERLGRGKAYYDNYLHQFAGVKIGICFECQLVKEVFNENHDIPMDYVVTEKSIYRRGK